MYEGISWEDATWRKSSFSYNGNSCVEVARKGDLVGVRNSNDLDGAVLVFNLTEWGAFTSGVKADEF
jgi:Domain of unknown function (DUF397)